MVSPLDAVLGALESQPATVRRRFAIRRTDQGATIHCGGMQMSISGLNDGRLAVVYEHAPHAVTREHLPPEAAARFLVALVMRECLCQVEVPKD